MLIFTFLLWMGPSQLELHLSNHCCDERQVLKVLMDTSLVGLCQSLQQWYYN